MNTMFPIFLLFPLLCTGLLAMDPFPVRNGGLGKELPLQINLNSVAGEEYNLNLVRAEGHVLHPNVKVISAGQNDDSGQLVLDTWSPSHEELQASQDVYIDEKNLAAIRLKNDGSGSHEMEGIVDGRKLDKNSNGFTVLSERSSRNHSDYIDLGEKITHDKFHTRHGPTEAVVEVALICDKEFGDIFRHDRVRILDYFTVYFWDLNLRYRTLPSVKISFRITAVVVISNTGGQPFIEQARGSDGKADFRRILPRFSSWAYENRNAFPKFDMAVAITNTRLEWTGGFAYMRHTCNSRGNLVLNDNGAWGSVTVGAHEIGHSLGAPHDDEPNFPGGCGERGHIMGGGNSLIINDELKWFFSTCSDRTIKDYVSSNQASCLRRIDHGGALPISTDFSLVQAPSMNEQCKRRLNNQQAFIDEADTANCKVMRCLTPMEGGLGINYLPPVDNTPCKDGGRCFRGRCRKPASLVMNVGTGQCMGAPNPFTHAVAIRMVNCIQPGTGTPLDRFLVYDEPNGRRLATPFSSPDSRENGERCLYTGNAEGNGLATDRCSAGNPWHGFDFLNVGNGEFLLQHRISKRCAKVEGANIRTYANSNGNDRNMHWKLQ